MARDMEDIDEDPSPPCHRSGFEKIGLFFYLFSLSEEWIDNYLRTHGGYSQDRLSEMPFKSRIEHWKKTACQTEPGNLCIARLFDRLFDLADSRNVIAHAIWREHRQQLHGTFTRKHDRRVITISGDADLDERIAKAKLCTAITDFWSC